VATDDDERTVADRVKATELEIPAAAGPDDEATQLNPPPHQLRPSEHVDAAKVTHAEMPKTDVQPPHTPAKPPVPEDDEETKAQLPPALLRKPRPSRPEDNTQTHPPPPPAPPGYYDNYGKDPKSKRGGTDEYPPPKPLHPLVVLSVAIAVLFFLLLAFNWIRTSHVLETEPETAPTGQMAR
jgi:hypothetical protein